MFSAAKNSLDSRPPISEIRSNILAGLTVGVIALPLSMALAIAIGVPPQNGLYTAIIAGSIIALTGGSRVNVSGPTAAFVVILIPIVQKYGLGGLLISGFLSGVLLMIMGFLRLGNFIKIVPYPVTIGFTAGIGVVIATLQIKDFLGLDIPALSGHFAEKAAAIFSALPTLSWQETAIGGLTFLILVFWGRLRTRIPSHLAALVTGSAVAWFAGLYTEDFNVATIASSFHYDYNGITGDGVPPFLPAFAWPWKVPGADGAPAGLSFELVRHLLFPAIAIAILGALESLLCAVVADGMSGKNHNPNDELIGQGIGNMIAPFFGCVPATAAIARTAANIRAGGTLPLASIVHALFILLSILVMAPLLGYIPMASMAALLLMVAWNMSEAKHFMRVIRSAPRNDILVLLTCFTLTVLIDMEIAVAVGMMLATMLFAHRSIELAGVQIVEHKKEERFLESDIPENILVYDINGPMFFGSTQKALSVLTKFRKEIKVVVLDMTDVTMLDMTAMVAFESIVADCAKRNIKLVVNNLNDRMIQKLHKVGVVRKEGLLEYTMTIDEAIAVASGMVSVNRNS